MNRTVQNILEFPVGMEYIHLIVIVVGGLLLILSSGIPVGLATSYIKKEENDIGDEFLRAGRVIGKCENILVLVFVLSGAYTALAVIFAAEGIVTRSVENDFYSVYVLAGTLVNFAYSILFSFILLFIVNSV